MAKKARIFEVTLRNGHGIWKETHPAQSEADLRNSLNIAPDVKLLSIVYVGWHVFDVQVNDEYHDLEFKTTVKDEEILFPKDSLGYDYLRRQFPKQAKEIDNFHITKNS
jgi:hypothetical protein